MARKSAKSAPEPGTYRRARPIYHDVDNRSHAERRAAEKYEIVREKSGFGLVGWIVLILLALFLLDTFLWKGEYRKAIWLSMNSNAESSRAWSDGLWR